MPNSMAPSLQAMQMLPFAGKLGLSESIAEHSTAMVRARANERWWEVRAMARREQWQEAVMAPGRRS